MIVVVFDVYGTEVVTEMTEAAFQNDVLNAHGNLTRPRWPYRWYRKEMAPAAVTAKVKKVRINDDHDPAIAAAKTARKAEKFAGVELAIAAAKAKTQKTVEDGIKAKKEEKEAKL